MAAAAGRLMAGGACGVLVTLEGRGSLLLLGREEQGAKEAAGAARRRCVDTCGFMHACVQRPWLQFYARGLGDALRGRPAQVRHAR